MDFVLTLIYIGDTSTYDGCNCRQKWVRKTKVSLGRLQGGQLIRRETSRGDHQGSEEGRLIRHPNVNRQTHSTEKRRRLAALRLGIWGRLTRGGADILILYSRSCVNINQDRSRVNTVEQVRRPAAMKKKRSRESHM
jgi:hypothetical protein